MKTKTILIAAVMFFALSVAAYAQATFAVGSIPVTTVVRSGLTEKTGDLTFNTIPGSPAVITGTISIYYGVSITATGTVYENESTTPSTLVTAAVAPTGTSLVLTIANPIAAPFGFKVTGVRVAVANTTLTSLSVNLSATGNAIQAGQTTGIPVITSISPGITSVSATSAQSFQAVEGGSGTVVLNITEGFINAFGVTATTDPTQNSSTMVMISVPRPMAGVSLIFPLTAASTVGNFTRADSTGALQATGLTISSLSSDPTYVFYRVTTDTSLTALDTLSIPIVVNATAPVTITGTIAVTASLAEIGTITTGHIPRYVVDWFGTPVIVTILPSTTYLLMPYAVSLPTMDYETGIAIANTTKRIAAFEDVVRQAGAITFYFYPQTTAAGTLPDVSSYTPTDNTVGSGLNADGKLAAGSTYAVTLSGLLAQASPPITGNFSGYILVVTNFTNAHGEYFIFTTWDAENPNPFTHGALMEVLNPDRNRYPEKLGF
jgi:hypothetical protein